MKPTDLSQLKNQSDETNQPLVLVIEDNPVEQKLFGIIQNQVGMVPCIVSDCVEGLKAAASLDFSVILLDLNMPQLDAIQCAQKIRAMSGARGIKTPIIAVTAHAMPGDREKCIDAGADDYLSKPFSVSELKQKIADWAA